MESAVENESLPEEISAEKEEINGSLASSTHSENILSSRDESRAEEEVSSSTDSVKGSSLISLERDESRNEQKPELLINSSYVQTADIKIMDESNQDAHTTQYVTFLHEGDLEKRLKLEVELNATVKDIKSKLSGQLGKSQENFKLMKDGKKLHLKSELAQDCGEILIESGVDDSEVESEGDEKNREPLFAPTERTIKFQFERRDGKKKYVDMTIVNMAYSKQYCGGYRNKNTGVIYFNAWCQTDVRRPRASAIPGAPLIKLYSRETQTLLPLIDRSINTMTNKCTQMSNREVYTSCSGDRIITARPYIPFDTLYKTMTPHEAVLIIQRAWRAHIELKRIRQYYKAMADTRDAKSQFKGTNLQEFRKHQLQLLTKDSYPIGRADFYDLYSVLGEWKKMELKKLRENKIGFAYKAAVANLHKQETKGLLEIETHRIRALEENLRRQDILFLEVTSRSRVRQYPKGNVTIIDDLNILKAREFKEMFASYKRTDVTKEERIEILSGIKHCLASFEAVDITMDLIELLDREIDFIQMGIQDKMMAMLRKRFESLYMNLVKNPEFNPQAKYYKKSIMTTKKYASYRCEGCRKVLNPSQLFMHLRIRRFKLCASCNYMQTTATASTNLAPYKRILNSLRVAEQERCCRSALSFLLQPWGMFFLVNVLWNGKSIISGSSYIPGLKVTRWLPDQEWSMWNMILLTELEAHKHERIKNPIEHYSKEFVLNVTNRNILGRMHFSAVADIDEKFRTRLPLGYLPEDHLLYTTKKQAAFLPKNDVHPTLIPNTIKNTAAGSNKQCEAQTTTSPTEK